MQEIFAIYDKSSGNLNLKAGYDIYEDEDIIIYPCGQIETDENGLSLKELYFLHKENIIQHLNGLYICLFYNKKKKTLLVVQDMFTGPLTLYYINNQSKLYLATSLKKILLASKIQRKFNLKAVEEFIKNGFINSRDTLISNINKIEVYHSLVANYEKISQIKSRFTVDNCSENQAKVKWFDVLDGVIKKQITNLRTTGLTLSSGYDTNYILHSLKKWVKEKLDVFCVGGEHGRNEIPAVKDILKNYTDVELHDLLVNSDVLQKMPDIVWRLEGSVYESGIFLQYVLAQHASSAGKNEMICGEGADQVFRSDFYPDKCPESIIYEKNSPKYSFKNNPYEMLAFCIIKKSSIMLSSFGICGKYPYLDNNVMILGKALRNLNGYNKAFHKQQCALALNKEVSSCLQKVGGATSCSALFQNEKQSRKLLQFVKKYKIGKLRINKFNIFLQVIYKSAMRKLFKNRLREHVSLKKFAFEYIMSISLVYVYLKIFDELFISGKCDHFYDKSECNMKLNDIIDVESI